jgi:hypothetical protein
MLEAKTKGEAGREEKKEARMLFLVLRLLSDIGRVACDPHPGGCCIHKEGRHDPDHTRNDSARQWIVLQSVDCVEPASDPYRRFDDCSA